MNAASHSSRLSDSAQERVADEANEASISSWGRVSPGQGRNSPSATHAPDDLSSKPAPQTASGSMLTDEVLFVYSLLCFVTVFRWACSSLSALRVARDRCDESTQRLRLSATVHSRSHQASLRLFNELRDPSQNLLQLLSMPSPKVLSSRPEYCQSLNTHQCCPRLSLRWTPWTWLL